MNLGTEKSEASNSTTSLAALIAVPQLLEHFAIENRAIIFTSIRDLVRAGRACGVDLVALRPVVEQTLESGSKAEMTAAIALLPLTHGTDALALLTGILRAFEWDTWRAALIAIAEIGGDDAFGLLKQQLRRCMRGDSPSTIYGNLEHVIDALGAARHPQTTPLLKSFYATFCDAWNRHPSGSGKQIEHGTERVVWALSDTPGSEALRLLLDLVPSSPSNPWESGRVVSVHEARKLQERFRRSHHEDESWDLIGIDARYGNQIWALEARMNTIIAEHEARHSTSRRHSRAPSA